MYPELPSSSRGVLDLALARSPENYQKRAPGLKNVLTYPTHTPSHGNSHDPQEEQADLEKHLWPSCPWMKSCWRRPRQRTRLVRKCAVMFFFVLSTVSEIPPTIASLRPASLQRQEAHPGRRHALSHHSGGPPHSRARHRLVAATPSTWKVQRKVHILEVEHSRS